MSYIGNPPAEAYTNTVKDTFSGDGSTTAFTMSQISLTNDVRVVVENVVQDPTVAYSCAGTTLTFTSAPPTGTNNIYVVHLGPAVMTALPPAEIAQATTFNSNVSVGGNLTVDTNTLYVDSTNNNVGIRTSSPSFESGTGTGLEINNSSGNGAHVKLTDAASGSGGTNGFDLYAFNTSGYIENYEAGSIVFRNGGSERARVDASGNLLVGKTTTASDPDTGMVLQSNGIFKSTSDGTRAGDFNRGTSDGEIVRLSKDGTTVGSIDSFYGNPMIGKESGARIAFSSTGIYSSNNSGTTEDASYALGTSSSRFTDLYLSGGVYLGGTGSANKLDDYEEGTFSPFFLGAGQNPSISYSSQQGVYTKIGRMVHLSIMLSWTGKSGGSGQLSIGGLPFASNGTSRGVASIAYNDNGLIGSNGSILIHSNSSSSAIYFLVPSSTFQSATYIQADSGGLASGAGTFQIAMTYQTS